MNDYCFLRFDSLYLTVFDWSDFVNISFTHHSEILAKTESLEQRKFYIHQCAVHSWTVAKLKIFLKDNLFGQRAVLPNNFVETLPAEKYAAKAVGVEFNNHFTGISKTIPMPKGASKTILPLLGELTFLGWILEGG